MCIRALRDGEVEGGGRVMSGSAPQVIVNSENVCYLLNIYAFIFLFVGVVLVRVSWCGVREATRAVCVCVDVCL